MSPITSINLALHALLLSAIGWAFVQGIARDARHRAWASLLAVIASLIAPALMEAPRNAAVRTTVDAPAPAATSWKPDWKVPATAVMRAPLPTSKDAAPAMPPSSSITAVARRAAALWLAGSCVLGFRHVILCLAAWRWRRSLRCLNANERSLTYAPASCAALSIFDGQGCPCVAGLVRPVIAVPASIVSKWTPQQWRWLLRHEGEHIRGHDTLIAWSLGWAKALLWWNPFIHALAEQWTQAREEICDTAAIAPDDDPAAYSGFLLDIAAEMRPHAPALLHMAASKPARRLRARMVAMLAMRPVRERVSAAFLPMALAVTTAGSILVSCVGLKADAAQTDGESAALVTRIFKVPPDFLADGRGPTDPFSLESGVKTAPEKKTALTLLKGRGILFPEGAAAVFNPVTSQLIVKNTASNIDRIAMELEALRGEREVHQTQVYVTTKWVEIDTTKKDSQATVDINALAIGKTDGDSTVLTDPQFQVVIRALSQNKGVDLLSAPSFTTRIGQQATVEVLREVFTKVHAQSAAKGLPAPEPDFIGVRNDVLVQFDGDQLKLRMEADIGELHSGGAPWLFKSGFKMPADPKIEHLRKTRTVTLSNGHTVMLRMGKSPAKPDRVVLLFVTTTLIDPSGKPISAADGVQRARRAEAMRNEEGKAMQDESKRREGKPVTIEVKTIDLHTGKDADWLKVITDAIWTTPRATKPENSEPQTEANELEPSQLAPGLYSLAGVFTPAQFETVLRTMAKRGDVKVVSYPAMTTPSSKAATISSKVMLADKALGGFSITVTPAIGPDGYTIDLSIAVTDHSNGTRTGPITTAVTIWDGQTVVLGGLVGEDEKGSLSRLVFITAKMSE